MGRLIIEGNQVYEMDEECLRKKAKEEAGRKIEQDPVDRRQQSFKDKK